jgi:hypothetical protein
VPIDLICVNKALRGQCWELDLDGEQAVFLNTDGDVVAEVGPEQALALFQMPSFSESIKYFGLRTEDGILQFEVSKEALKQIKLFVNRTIASAGPEAVAAVRNKAIRDTVIGIAAVVGGLGVTAYGYLAAAMSPGGGKYTVFWGIVLLGVIMIGKGIYGFRQHALLKSL